MARRFREYKDKVLKIGIVGCGAIGSVLARACGRDLKGKAELAALYDIDAEKSVALEKKIRPRLAVLSLRRLMEKSDLVIEAASAEISPTVAEMAISYGKDAMIMSVGGLLGREDLFDKAKKRGRRIYLPSGALCGLDGVKAAKEGRISSVCITTSKPAKGLDGAPYIRRNKIALNKIRKKALIFDGTAKEAVKAFPKNINVSAALSLAGVGAKRTRVKIFVSPKNKSNIHEIELKGDFGRIYTRCENVPSAQNPKTSALAALSAVATLKGIVEAVKVGT